MKPDTPQSDNGLQIDTDTEEPDDTNALQIDESVTNEDSKPESPRDKKPSGKDIDTKSSELGKSSVLFTVESAQDPIGIKNDEKSQLECSQKTTIVTPAKSYVEPPVLPPILPPIIPKMAEAPTELLSVTISTPTMNKPNIIQVPSISNDKSKPSPPSKYLFNHQPRNFVAQKSQNIVSFSFLSQTLQVQLSIILKHLRLHSPQHRQQPFKIRF